MKRRGWIGTRDSRADRVTWVKGNGLTVEIWVEVMGRDVVVRVVAAEKRDRSGTEGRVGGGGLMVERSTVGWRKRARGRGVKAEREGRWRRGL